MSAGEWRRVSKRRPCPICGKPDWCLVARDESAAICARTESPKRCGEAGWLHKLRKLDERSQEQPTRRVTVLNRPMPNQDFGELAERYTAATNTDALARFADELGVSVDALRRLRVGCDGEAWTFPMVDAAGAVIGIRRRLSDGRKLSVRGGHEGLFVPCELPASESLLVAEGPTDTAALLTIGFACIGRPSCRGGVRFVCDIARGREAVIVADGDEPGRLGAETLASVLLLYCSSVRVVAPPSGVKDARCWVQSGGTRADVQAAIDAAPAAQLTTNTRRVGA